MQITRSKVCQSFLSLAASNFIVRHNERGFILRRTWKLQVPTVSFLFDGLVFCTGANDIWS